MADLWDDHDSYWRNTYSTRPYASGRTYDDLRGGYRYGYESANRYKGRGGRTWSPICRVTGTHTRIAARARGRT